MKRLAIMSITVLALAGCAWTGTGTVTGKNSEPGEWENRKKCTTIYSGKVPVTTCRTKREWDDPDWSLQIKDSKDGTTHWVDVTEQEFTTHPVGSTYTH